MIGAMLIVIAAAALCAYATLGLLFYQGQWQFVLHPAKAVTAIPGASFDEVHFDVTSAGAPRLDGWWIPAGAGARWSGDTILYFHGGAGSLSNCIGDLDALHALGINVFAFDYRGYGKSAGPHPTEARMNQDAAAAWNYLIQTRHLASDSIVLYGAGVGASLGAEIAARHAPAGVVLEAPNEPARKLIESDGRAKILPMWLLLNERFDPAPALKSLSAPKLFIDRNRAKPRTRRLYSEAAPPKEYFELKDNAGYPATMERFLDQVLR